jgi:hypothetical protein
MSTLLSERRQPIIAPRLRERGDPAQRATPASARHEPAVPCRAVVAAPRASWSLILLGRQIFATARRTWIFVAETPFGYDRYCAPESFSCSSAQQALPLQAH